MRAHEGVPVVSSRDVADRFEKRHADVLRDIDAILDPNADLRSGGWFIETSYFDVQGQERRAFDLTRQGFTLLVMGWTGEKASLIAKSREPTTGKPPSAHCDSVNSVLVEKVINTQGWRSWHKATAKSTKPC